VSKAIFPHNVEFTDVYFVSVTVIYRQ